MRRMENNYRSRLSEMHLSAIMRIDMDGTCYLDYESTNVVDKIRKSNVRRFGDSGKQSEKSKKRTSDCGNEIAVVASKK